MAVAHDNLSKEPEAAMPVRRPTKNTNESIGGENHRPDK